MLLTTPIHYLVTCWRKMNFEEGLKEAGYFGRYQKKLLLILFLFQFICPAIILSITYIGMSPEWVCTSERNNNTSLHFSPDKRCHYFEGEPHNCTPSYEEGFYTIAEEWNLICSRSHLINLTQSGFFFGFLVGAFVLGKLADSIGRRKVTIMILVCGAIVMMLNALSPSLTLFAICRFVAGFLFAGVMAFYVLASEIVGPGQRGLVSVGTSLMFALGFVFLSFIAYVIQDWRRLMIFVSLLYIPFLTMYRNIPESPRWLLTIQEEVKARRILIDIARTNKKTLPSDFSLKCASSSGDQPSAGLIALFRHRVLFRRTLIMAFIWFTVCMVYYGLSLGVGSLSSNLYISFSLSGLVEVPSNLVAYVILDKLGRKWSNIITLALGGTAALGCSFVQITGINSGGSLQMTLALLGKFSISASFCVLFAYTPELYSTDVRNLGIALCNVLARFGGIIAPVVILLDESGPGLSMLVMGMLSVTAALLGLGVPETFNAPLPNTIHDIK